MEVPSRAHGCRGDTWAEGQMAAFCSWDTHTQTALSDEHLDTHTNTLLNLHPAPSSLSLTLLSFSIHLSSIAR